jgi:hypothetical protein
VSEPCVDLALGIKVGRCQAAAVAPVLVKGEATSISDIHSWMVLADGKLEHPYDAAESGEYLEKMLEHIGRSTMLEPL